MVDYGQLLLNLVAGGLGAIIVIIWNTVIPLVINRVWKRNMPDIRVTSRAGYIWNEKGITNHRFDLGLKLDNGTDSPLSFSTPRFYVRTGGYTQNTKKWEEASLITQGFTYGEYLDGKAPTMPTHVDDTVPKNPFQAKKIRVEAHDFVESSVSFDLHKAPEWKSVV